MSVHEGARRMRIAGRGMVIAGLVLFAVWACLFAFAAFTRAGMEAPIPGAPVVLLLFVPAIYIAGTGALLWLAGWIVEGFGNDVHGNQSS